jgi:hypothetical protein
MERQTWLRMPVLKTGVRQKVLVLAARQPKRVSKPKNQQDSVDAIGSNAKD